MHIINTVLNGEASEQLKSIPDESIDMCITSPPYWGLRDYRHPDQLGQEKDSNLYINKLCDIFDEVKRVLKSSGTCWVNLGDTYGGTSKSLCQIPSRFAIEMCNRGWILRNEIIWHKPNVMPCSVKDRFTVDFEKLFFFTKNKKYHFEQQHEPYAPSSDVRYRQALRAGRSYKSKAPYKNNTPYSSYKRGQGSVVSRGNDADGLVVGGNNEKGRNKRCVWRIPTKPYLGAHFAVYPKELIETPIKAGCPVGGIVLDPFIGSGTTAVVATELKRNFIGIELNPEYIDLIKKRLKIGTN